MRVLVNIDVDDLPRATKFYVDCFELEIGRRLGAVGIELLGGGVAFYLLLKEAGTRAVAETETEAATGTEARTGTGPAKATEAAPAAVSKPALTRSYARHWTPVHLDFVVDDLPRATARAIAAGAVLERDIEHHDWGSIAGFSDPFGHGFCLLRFTERGYDAIAVA